jgi:acetolactate synthase-1/2/3 large subunit
VLRRRRRDADDGQEIATAFHHAVAPIVLVFNNQMYGTIRMHQERPSPAACPAPR